MIFEKPLLNSSELQLDYLLHDVVGNRIIRNDDRSPQERRLEDFEQVRTQSVGERVRFRFGIGVSTELRDRLGAFLFTLASVLSNQ